LEGPQHALLQARVLQVRKRSSKFLTLRFCVIWRGRNTHSSRHVFCKWERKKIIKIFYSSFFVSCHPGTLPTGVHVFCKFLKIEMFITRLI
jgi:hypothetical protein